MEYSELAGGFASKFGVEGASAEGGACMFEIDGMKVSFLHDEEADAVTVYGEIGLPPPDADARLGEVMLRANNLLEGTGGAVLCQNPETRAYAIFKTFPLAGMDVETFSADVEKLVNQVEDWKQIAAGLRTAEEAADETKEDAHDAFADIPAGGFMQV